MHGSVMVWGLRTLVRETRPGARYIEAGALNVNGSLRRFVERKLQPQSYVGFDLQPGKGVDVIMDAAHLPREAADVVICTEMLEHAPDWRAALEGVKGALAAGGLLVLTTRGPGFPRHDYPGDHWRFTVDLLTRACEDLDLLDVQPDPEAPGVMLAGRWYAGDHLVPELDHLEAVPAP